ncbi:MAG: hypothetical protein AMXMBFR82_20060 [Candidatus Hydrogenedentota bacterium]
MTSTIDKKVERHTVKEMMKRDGETYMAVGLFVIAIAIPVLIATLWAVRSHAAVVNVIAGLILLGVGGSALFYGWILFKRSKTIAS